MQDHEIERTAPFLVMRRADAHLFSPSVRQGEFADLTQLPCVPGCHVSGSCSTMRGLTFWQRVDCFHIFKLGAQEDEQPISSSYSNVVGPRAQLSSLADEVLLGSTKEGPLTLR